MSRILGCCLAQGSSRQIKWVGGEDGRGKEERVLDSG